MWIKVTEDHIKRGLKRSDWSCPVALAIKEATGKSITVPLQGRVQTEQDRVFSRCGTEVEGLREWIGDYDAGNKVEPRSFNIPKEVFE